MDKGVLKALWAGMFIFCAIMGFVPEPQGFNKWMLTFFSLLFFLPAGFLLWQSFKEKNRKELKLIRNLSIVSLGVTVVMLVVNMLSVLFSETVGNVLYWGLIILSSPMVCSQIWALSLFLWACLLWCSILALAKLKKSGN